MTGGTEQYFRDLSTLLERNGHNTIPFAVHHPNNPETPYSKYFLSSLDYRDKSFMYRVKNVYRILSGTLYSLEAKRQMTRLIKDHQPDIAHIQSIEHHISPSILHSLNKYSIPIVQSINTYKLVCASYRLYLVDKHQICERCLYGKHYHAVQTRCVKGSFAASFLAMIEMYLHETMNIYNLVDRFIVSNDFMASKLVDAGYDSNKVIKLLNPLSLEDYQVSTSFDDYILYFGRLDPEKGVSTLLKAMKYLPQLRLVIVGDGSQMASLEQWVSQNQLNNIDFVGAKWGNELAPYLNRARLVVVPSIWYEPSPYVVYQAFASGKPVIAADIGGIPELVNEESGALFAPGNVEDLVEKLESLAFDDKKLKTKGRYARSWVEKHLDPQTYYRKLDNIYREVIQEKKVHH